MRSFRILGGLMGPFLVFLLWNFLNIPCYAQALAPRYSTLGAQIDLNAPPTTDRCAACTVPITAGEGYLEALGQKWHPEHLLCHNCHSPFPDGRFIPDQEKRHPYCETCYHELFSEKCQICTRPLIGNYYQTFFGEKYCQTHHGQLEACFSCNRPISEALTQGGMRYRDGRAVCNLCRPQCVDTEAQAQHLYQIVWRDLTALGFDLGSPRPVLRLVDKVGATNVEGTTHITTHSQNGQPVGQSMEIQILFGLPRAHFASIVAHELGHVYIGRWHHPVPLPTQVEEGLCELMACTWLATQGGRDPNAHYRYQAKLKSDDPVYGGGLRAALAAVQGNVQDAVKLFSYVYQHGRFP